MALPTRFGAVKRRLPSDDMSWQLSSFLTPMSSDRVGSDPLGQALKAWTCARSHDSQGAISPCGQIGASFCSKVILYAVYYFTELTLTLSVLQVSSSKG